MTAAEPASTIEAITGAEPVYMTAAVPFWRTLPAHRRFLLRVLLEGLLIWGVIHGSLAVGNQVSGGGDVFAFVRLGTILLTAVILVIDLRASRDLLFHANLGLGARFIVGVGVLPGVVAEVLLHARQVMGG